MLLFLYERDGVYRSLHGLVAPQQRNSVGGECPLPAPGSDVDKFLKHECPRPSFCSLLVTVARITKRGSKDFCQSPSEVGCSLGL